LIVGKTASLAHVLTVLSKEDFGKTSEVNWKTLEVRRRPAEDSGRPSEDLPSGHADSEQCKRSSRVLIRLSDLEGNTSTALSNRTADRPSIREDV